MTNQWLKNFRWILGLILGIIGFIVGGKFLAPLYFYIDFIDKRILKGKSFVRHTPHHAKEFFINKVIKQAAEDDIRLTSTEKEMLDWEDLDPRYPEYWNLELGERFEKEVDYVDFSIARVALAGWNGEPFTVQVIVTDNGDTQIADKTAPVSTDSTTGRAKVVLVFENMLDMVN